MSDQKLVSPLLDGFIMGDPISGHDGVRCHPAIRENTDNKYIVKVITVPASQKQLDALLLTGAFKNAAAATAYFKELADGTVSEAETLQQLAKLEGFVPYDGWQIVPMEGGDLGYQIYLVSPYKRSLEKFMRRNPMTHLGAVNLGLDLCAALAVCRKAGYLYVDLKPTNIFITEDKEYRIGDLGFVKLDSLKYASLPVRYSSAYSAPELRDPMVTLNTTADIYSVGMVLYQIYNNGQLPTQKELAEGLPTPMNADYEMAEIIQKACAVNPKDRWQDPVEMGQALVSYMQRNVINDTPILPPLMEKPVQEEPAAKPAAEEEENLLAGNPAAAPVQEAPMMEESFDDQTVPEAAAEEELGEAEMTDEVNSMLAQADDLLVADVPSAEEELDDMDDLDKDEDFDFDFDDDENKEDDEEEFDDEDEDEEDYIPEPQPEKPRRKKSKKGKGFLTVLILLLVVALLGGGAFYYYQNYYLMSISDMEVTGEHNQMTVIITSDVDDALLTAVCTDTYGNKLQAPVVNGQAQFTDLNPGTAYKVTLEVSGFHALTGATYATYETDNQTEILNFNAITGNEDGSVILNFTVNGPEQEWMVKYSTDGEAEKTVSFPGHTVTITGLTVGSTYTFQLVADPSSDLYVAGDSILAFTASKIVVAEKLTIVSCVDGVLTAQWKAPADSAVTEWTVRCYAEDGYDETVTTADTTIQFSGIDTTKAYTIEVMADGMTQGARAYVTANPLTVSDITVDAETEPGKLNVSWNFSGTAPEGGWLLMYGMDGSNDQDVVKCEEASGVIENLVPNCTYNLTIQAADGSTVFGCLADHQVPAAESFEEQGLKADLIEANFLPTPAEAEWKPGEIDDGMFTTQFSSDDEITLLLYGTEKFYTRKADIEILYVIRDAAGKVIGELVETESKDWSSMWTTDHYCALEIPVLPGAAGEYSLELYFNGALAVDKNFSIT